MFEIGSPERRGCAAEHQEERLLVVVHSHALEADDVFVSELSCGRAAQDEEINGVGGRQKEAVTRDGARCARQDLLQRRRGLEATAHRAEPPPAAPSARSPLLLWSAARGHGGEDETFVAA